MREDQPSPSFVSAREAAIDEQLTYDWGQFDEGFEPEDADWDGQPDEAQEWESFDPDC